MTRPGWWLIGTAFALWLVVAMPVGAQNYMWASINGIPLAPGLRTTGNILPDTNGTLGLGSTALVWSTADVYTVRVYSQITLPSQTFTPQGSPPGGATSGMMYVDSTPTPDELCFYDGANWQALASGTDANCQ